LKSLCTKIPPEFSGFSKRTQRTNSLIHSTSKKLKSLKEQNLAVLEVANFKNEVLEASRFEKSRRFAKRIIQSSLNKEYRKKGIAKKLIDSILKKWQNKSKSIVLLTSNKNTKIFNRLGFKKAMNFMEYNKK
jgi:predicted acetyltransferase